MGDDVPRQGQGMGKLLLAIAICALAAQARAESFTRNAPPFGPRQIESALDVTTTTDPTSAGFEWVIHGVLNNHANTDGENVAVYGQAFKMGHGTTWAGVFETQDFDGTNGAWGLEVDLAGNGLSRPESLRVGVGMILWRDSLHRFAPYKYSADYGFWLTPGYGPEGWEPVDVRYGFRSDAHCTVACVSVKSGERVCFDDAGEICMSFDAQTGYLSFTNRGRAVFQFQMDTAAIQQHPR